MVAFPSVATGWQQNLDFRGCVAATAVYTNDKKTAKKYGLLWFSGVTDCHHATAHFLGPRCWPIIKAAGIKAE